MYAASLLSVVIAVLFWSVGCATVDTKPLEKLGENLAKAADLVDPMALKEIYRDTKNLNDTNRKLEAMIAQLQSPGGGAPTAESFEVVAECTDEGIDASSTFVVLASQWSSKEGGGMDWGPDQEVIRGTCSGPRHSIAHTVRFNKNTRGFGKYRISWHYQRGRMTVHVNEFCVRIAFKDGDKADRKIDRCCTARGNNCDPFDPGKEVGGRSETVWVRATPQTPQ